MFLDFVISASIDQKINALITATHDNIMKVSARLSSGALSIERLVPEGSLDAGNALINYDSVVIDKFGITGFYGYELGIEVVGSLLNENYLVRTSVALGLEATYTKMLPPFPPINSTGASTIGSCDTCHLARATGEIVGQNLKTQIFQNEDLEKEKIHDSKVFSIPLPIVCLLSAPC